MYLTMFSFASAGSLNFVPHQKDISSSDCPAWIERRRLLTAPATKYDENLPGRLPWFPDHSAPLS